MWKSVLKVGLPVAGLVGGGYAFHRQNEKGKLKWFKDHYAYDPYGYQLDKSKWNEHRSELNTATTLKETNAQKQQALLMQMAPLQQQLAETKQTEDQLNSLVKKHNRESLELKYKLVEAKRLERVYLEEYRERLAQDKEKQLQKLNSVAYKEYQRKCEENESDLRKKEVNDFLSEANSVCQAEKLLQEMSMNT